jgi:peptidoglycan/xylan/chitin deacetylase (PgdA/CDA1 family)
MARIVTGGIVATVAVIIVGVVVALPPFLQPPKGPSVLLSFNIVNDNNMPVWCRGLADILSKNQLDAAVFFSGEIAEKYPECVSSFGENVDIGSSTYSYRNLTGISDYTEQLRQVGDGKKAVDLAGNFDSKSFRAPYGSTDENIYSLLSRSGILADFSYSDRYHKYYEDKFIWFELIVYNASSPSVSAEYIRTNLPDGRTGEPINIDIDNSVPLDKVQQIIDVLQDKGSNFVNASELTGIALTTRAEDEL